MECKFVAGQKVVCIRDDWCSNVGKTPADYGYSLHPVKGETYTIQTIECFTITARHPGAHLQFKEMEGWWHHASFKPLDLQIFEDMLKLTLHDNLFNAQSKVDKFDNIKAREDA